MEVRDLVWNHLYIFFNLLHTARRLWGTGKRWGKDNALEAKSILISSLVSLTLCFLEIFWLSKSVVFRRPDPLIVPSISRLLSIFQLTAER